MFLDAKCPHLVVGIDRNGDIAIWICALMTGDQDHEGNCGMYPCPISKDKKEMI